MPFTRAQSGVNRKYALSLPHLAEHVSRRHLSVGIRVSRIIIMRLHGCPELGHRDLSVSRGHPSRRTVQRGAPACEPTSRAASSASCPCARHRTRPQPGRHPGPVHRLDPELGMPCRFIGRDGASLIGIHGSHHPAAMAPARPTAAELPHPAASYPGRLATCHSRWRMPQLIQSAPSSLPSGRPFANAVRGKLRRRGLISSAVLSSRVLLWQRPCRTRTTWPLLALSSGIE